MTEWIWECDDLGIPNVCAVFGACTVWVRDMAILDGRLRGFIGRWEVVAQPTDDCNRLQWRFFELGTLCVSHRVPLMRYRRFSTLWTAGR